MPQGRRVATQAPAPFSGANPSTVVISNDGDILIQIKDTTTCTDHCYRCSRDVLHSASEYFNVLLDPVKFSEGIAIEARLQDLTRQYNDSAAIPASELPKVVVSDVGALPEGCISTGTVVRLFFKILHDPSTSWPVLRAHSVNLIALLSIVADRFACSNTIAEYLIRQGLEITLLKDRKSATTQEIELENRQRLLAGLFFGFPDWVRQCSAALIVEASKRQNSTEDEEREGEDALWWILPGGVEEELACRRDYVLDTLSSIQKHFINLYISKQTQCRLGYSSSPQCDAYQLGEIIRFLCRKGRTLRIESAFDPAPEELEPYNGNLNDIIAKLKECPSYQIDDNHTHCGARTRLMPVLERLRPSFQVGICSGCWKEDKSKESWLENPAGGTWANAGERFHGRGCRAHRDTKAMYTAVKRDWTPVYAL